MEFRQEPGRIFATGEDGRLLAEVTFPEREGAAEIDHTFVDPSLRGQGVAGQLLQAAADTLRAQAARRGPPAPTRCAGLRPIRSTPICWYEKKRACGSRPALLWKNRTRHLLLYACGVQ